MVKPIPPNYKDVMFEQGDRCAYCIDIKKALGDDRCEKHKCYVALYYVCDDFNNGKENNK